MNEYDVAGSSGEVGHFTYATATESWWWSDGMYALYGYTPGQDVLTVDLVASHKHPDDAARANRAREQAMRSGGTYSCYHRIVDRAGQVRSVHTVARSITDRSGTVDRVEGFCVDLSTERRTETQEEVRSALAGFAEHRAAIEQAKGMVMVATGCTSEESFECLARYSQNANIKVHEIARRLVQAVEAERGSTDTVVRVLADLVAPSRAAALDTTA